MSDPKVFPFLSRDSAFHLPETAHSRLRSPGSEMLIPLARRIQIVEGSETNSSKSTISTAPVWKIPLAVSSSVKVIVPSPRTQAADERKKEAQASFVHIQQGIQPSDDIPALSVGVVSKAQERLQRCDTLLVAPSSQCSDVASPEKQSTGITSGRDVSLSPPKKKVSVASNERLNLPTIRSRDMTTLTSGLLSIVRCHFLTTKFTEDNLFEMSRPSFPHIRPDFLRLSCKIVVETMEFTTDRLLIEAHAQQLSGNVLPFPTDAAVHIIT